MSSTNESPDVLQIMQLASDLRGPISEQFELPEPAFALDLESRKGDELRQFKHIHQGSALHAENFVRANQIKVVTLVDGYLTVVAAKNPLAPYLLARTLLELCAFLYDVSQRLRTIADKSDPTWKSKGQEFFALMVRARYATTHPARRSALEAAGLSASSKDPINVKRSLEELAKSPTWGDLAREYDALCDFVHHNLSSQVTNSAGFRVGGLVTFSGGGGMLMPASGPITRYEYPLPTKAALAIQETAGTVLKSVKSCVQSLNELPRTPFSKAQLVQMTGNPLGFGRVRP